MENNESENKVLTEVAKGDKYNAYTFDPRFVDCIAAGGDDPSDAIERFSEAARLHQLATGDQ